MAESNHFLVNRKLLQSDLWLGEPFSRGQAWIDMLGLARWADGTARVRGVPVQLKRGQLAWSIKGLAIRWHWSQGKVKRFLKDLENEDQIGAQISNVTTVITITNYDAYQKTERQTESRRRADGEQTVSKRRANGDERKKDKEIKRREKEGKGSAPTHASDQTGLPITEDYPRIPARLQDPDGQVRRAACDWISYLSGENGRPPQPMQIEQQMIELGRRATDVQDAIEIIRRSIRKGSRRDLYYEDFSTAPAVSEPGMSLADRLRAEEGGR